MAYNVSKSGKAKVQKVMSEFAGGQLHSGSGSKVTDKKQALAIALSESRKAPTRRRR